MIAILFCSRVKDNPDSNIKRLLDTAVATTTPEEREQIEFLVKFDDDDDQRPPDSFFAQYPLKIRLFSWSRGEGRHYLHHAQEYMFAQRDPRSSYCLMTADDFRFTRPNWVTEIHSFKEEFCIISPFVPPIPSFKGIYENDEAIRRWVVSFGPLSPVLSARLMEVCQNFGWQSNVDSWAMGLSIVLFDLYGIILWRMMPGYYERNGGVGMGDTPTYNNMELTGQKGPENKYWFELVRRQARNVYLNIMFGTDYRKRAPLSLRVWKKVRAQPLRRLPIRVFRKIMRGVRMLLA